MIHRRKIKAIGLFSGSLDSLLAGKLIAEQGVDIVALNFNLPFPVPGRTPSSECLEGMAAFLGASLISLPADEGYLELLRSPEFGYFRGMAPCVDCMVYMLRKAKELMREIKADFVFTGEVLGQQISQNKHSLNLIERVSGLRGRLLRPLSAKVLEPTIVELSGAIRRERLLDFQGRSRHRQLKLAREFGFGEYPIPGTGCLLTDSNFAARCRDAVAHQELSFEEIELMSYGRHFRLKSGAKVIVGRDEEENKVLEERFGNRGLLLKPMAVPGPVVLLRTKKITKKDIEIAGRICTRYCDTLKRRAVKIKCGEQNISCKPLKDEEMAEWRIMANSREHRQKNTQRSTLSGGKAKVKRQKVEKNDRGNKRKNKTGN